MLQNTKVSQSQPEHVNTKTSPMYAQKYATAKFNPQPRLYVNKTDGGIGSNARGYCEDGA